MFSSGQMAPRQTLRILWTLSTPNIFSPGMKKIRINRSAIIARGKTTIPRKTTGKERDPCDFNAQHKDPGPQGSDQREL